MKEIEENAIIENQDNADANEDVNDEVEVANNNLTKSLNLPDRTSLNNTFFKRYSHDMRNKIHHPDSRMSTNVHVEM